MWTPQLKHVDSQFANLIPQLLLAPRGTKIPSEAIWARAILGLTVKANVIANLRPEFALEISELMWVLAPIPAEAWSNEGMAVSE